MLAVNCGGPASLLATSLGACPHVGLISSEHRRRLEGRRLEHGLLLPTARWLSFARQPRDRLECALHQHLHLHLHISCPREAPD